MMQDREEKKSEKETVALYSEYIESRSRKSRDMYRSRLEFLLTFLHALLGGNNRNMLYNIDLAENRMHSEWKDNRDHYDHASALDDRLHEVNKRFPEKISVEEAKICFYEILALPKVQTILLNGVTCKKDLDHLAIFLNGLGPLLHLDLVVRLFVRFLLYLY